MAGQLAWLLVGVTASGAGLILARHFDAALHRWIALALCLVIAATVSLLAQDRSDWMYLIWTGLLLAGWTALAITDALRHEIPDAISMPLLILGLLYQYVSGFSFQSSLLAVAALFVVAGLVGLTAQRWRDGVGGGDIVLLGIALAWVGPLRIVDTLLLTAFFLIPQIAHVIVTGSRAQSSLAPSLAIATLVVWFTGSLL